MGITEDTALRARVDLLLRAGLKTEWQIRAYGDEAIAAVVSRLRQVARDDHNAVLKIAGFTAYPYSQKCLDGRRIDQGCSNCRYFERHRAFCRLPEIALPVKPEWSCVLWRT